MKHKQHRGTQDNSSWRKNYPKQFHTGQDQYDKSLHTAVEPHRQGYIYTKLVLLLRS